ncbi:hypothetical protein E1A91_A12G044300v1 [Gossypium mustelinum]|uniref:Uncharacterized protein n=1 Tax=Gossypium mustelinum TaxID=34275 RepID=A0A5D2WPJ5_GOSMU|nr:hypothetical protein E1A91_A12G044300v1 [Gossypium mustelinum]TYJ03676.1 hypothetical protein E1A91_A12G044300v1 [Gossypium mustelinum]
MLRPSPLLIRHSYSHNLCPRRNPTQQKICESPSKSLPLLLIHSHQVVFLDQEPGSTPTLQPQKTDGIFVFKIVPEQIASAFSFLTTNPEHDSLFCLLKATLKFIFTFDLIGIYFDFRPYRSDPSVRMEPTFRYKSIQII